MKEMGRSAERLVPGLRRFASRLLCESPTLWGITPHQVFWKILELLMLSLYVPYCPPKNGTYKKCPPPDPVGEKGGADGDPQRSFKHS